MGRISRQEDGQNQISIIAGTDTTTQTVGEKPHRHHHHHHHRRKHHHHHHHHNSSKLVPNPARIKKKILNKTGSYDLTTSLNSIDLDDDKIRLNSAEPLPETSLMSPDPFLSSTTTTTTSRFDPAAMMMMRSNEYGDEKVEFPKKCTCFGMPLTCFAYFAAVYSIVILSFFFLIYRSILVNFLCF